MKKNKGKEFLYTCIDTEVEHNTKHMKIKETLLIKSKKIFLQQHLQMICDTIRLD